MASISTDAKGNKLVKFRYGKRQFTKSANTKDQKVAESAKALVEDTIMRLNRGWLTVPDGADPGEFVMSGGKRTDKATVEAMTKSVTLGELFKMYDDNFPAGAKADTTMQTEGFHKAHHLRIFGADTIVEALTLADVQRYANRRSKETWRGKPILPPTILKELATFRYIWNWGRKQGCIQSSLPYLDKDLNFARTEQKPPFQTYEAINRAIKRNGLNDDEIAALWESLYLTIEEVHEVL